MMTVDNGQYVLGQPLMSSGQMTQYASASPTPNTNPFAQNKPLTEVK